MEQKQLFLIGALLSLVALSSWACAPTGVGDPCDPEAKPRDQDGNIVEFEDTETVLETSSLQCRTRICMFYNGTSFCTQRCETDEDCQADWYQEGPGEPGDEDNPTAYCEAEYNVGSPAIIGNYCVPYRASKQRQ